MNYTIYSSRNYVQIKSGSVGLNVSYMYLFGTHESLAVKPVFNGSEFNNNLGVSVYHGKTYSDLEKEIEKDLNATNCLSPDLSSSGEWANVIDLKVVSNKTVGNIFSGASWGPNCFGANFNVPPVNEDGTALNPNEFISKVVGSLLSEIQLVELVLAKNLSGNGHYVEVLLGKNESQFSHVLAFYQIPFRILNYCRNNNVIST